MLVDLTRLLLWSILSSISVTIISVHAQNYSTAGPCGHRWLQSHLLLPETSSCGMSCDLDVSLHLPDPVAGLTCSTAAPWPLVVFFVGFELQAGDYTSYAKHLASWGFAVVLYGLPLLHVVDDQVEVGFLPYLLHHVEQQPEVWGLLDTSHIAAAGHSRGGKIAALHLAGTPKVGTAFLIDPVDSSSFRPPTPENPSAVEMLRGLNKSAGIAGAGISGPCNPVTSNYHAFWEVLDTGSWLEVVPESGHMQFTDGDLETWALDLLCHKGHNTHQRTIALTVPALVAWMVSHLKRNIQAVVHEDDLEVTVLMPDAKFASKRIRQRKLMLNACRRAASASQDSRDVWQQQLHLPSDSLAEFFEWVNQEQSAGHIAFWTK